MDDQRPLPTAAELGVSDTEYERILRGVLGPDYEPLGSSPTRRRRARWPLVLFAVALGLTLLPRLGLIGQRDYEPTYKFIDTVGGQPVAYSSCRMIQVAVYPAGGPPDAEELVREAVDRVRSATGLDVVVIGSFGGYAANWNFEAAPVLPADPISVSWQDGDAIAELTDHIAGLGGSPVVNDANGIPHRVAGTIALSRDYYALLTRRGDHSEAVAVLMHEFGHVFGLDHVDSPRELMYDGNNDLNTFGPGDLEGLRRLGHGPCV